MGCRPPATRNWQIRFDDRFAAVPQAAVEKHPKFASHFDDTPYGKMLTARGASGRVRHIVVLFLYSGGYQDLEGLPAHPSERIRAAADRALDVYSFAVRYGLDGLAELTLRDFLEWSRYPAFTFPELVRKLYEKDIPLSEETRGLVEYMAERAGDIGKAGEQEQEQEGLQGYGGQMVKKPSTAAEVLFGTVLELRNRVIELESRR
ncbi:hypothetical protein ACJ41O_009990 [Fusarium nematophilum]